MSCTVRTAWISGPAGWERAGQSPKDKGTLHQLPVSVHEVNPQRSCTDHWPHGTQGQSAFSICAPRGWVHVERGQRCPVSGEL